MMKPEECRLETRGGNWVTVLPNGKARPSTKTELYLWLRLMELQKESDRTFDLTGKERLSH